MCAETPADAWLPVVERHHLLLDLCEVTPASTCVKNILSYLFLFVHPYVVLIASIECTHPSPKKIWASMVICILTASSCDQCVHTYMVDYWSSVSHVLLYILVCILERGNMGKDDLRGAGYSCMGTIISGYWFSKLQVMQIYSIQRHMVLFLQWRIFIHCT